MRARELATVVSRLVFALPRAIRRGSSPFRKSFTGFLLLESLTARVNAATAEQSAGSNPDALLHLAERGGMHWHSSFTADYLHPAMDAAGWPSTEWNDGKADRTVYRLT